MTKEESEQFEKLKAAIKDLKSTMYGNVLKIDFVHRILILIIFLVVFLFGIWVWCGNHM